MIEYVRQDQICDDKELVLSFVREKCNNRKCRSFDWDFYISDGVYYLHPRKAEELYLGLVHEPVTGSKF